MTPSITAWPPMSVAGTKNLCYERLFWTWRVTLPVVGINRRKSTVCSNQPSPEEVSLLFFFRDIVFTAETLDSTSSVNQLLLPGKEGMAG